MTKKEFVGAISPLIEVCESLPSETGYTIYYELLKNYEVIILKKAVLQMLKELKQHKFPPTGIFCEACEKVFEVWNNEKIEINGEQFPRYMTTITEHGYELKSEVRAREIMLSIHGEDFVKQYCKINASPIKKEIQ